MTRGRAGARDSDETAKRLRPCEVFRRGGRYRCAIRGCQGVAAGFVMTRARWEGLGFGRGLSRFSGVGRSEGSRGSTCTARVVESRSCAFAYRTRHDPRIARSCRLVAGGWWRRLFVGMRCCRWSSRGGQIGLELWRTRIGQGPRTPGCTGLISPSTECSVPLYPSAACGMRVPGLFAWGRIK